MSDAIMIVCCFVIMAAFYIGCGALFHWALIGDEMSISSAGTWGIMIAWPFALAVLYYVGMLIFAVVFAAVVRIKNALE